MTEKLTLADCFKYYNSRLIEKDGFKFNNIAEFLGCKFDSLDNYQLELRSIEQLTDEEKKYIFRNYLINVEFQYVQWDSFNHLSMYAVDVDVDLNYTGELIDYLRRQNIMIEKPDWFEIGKAVKDDK